MNNYWRKREEKHIRENQMNDARIAKRLAEKHEEAMQEIQKEIEAFYGRYADREGISMDIARKRVNKLDIDEYAKKAKRYVKEKNFTPKANEEMRLYNVTMKINRLQLLKAYVRLELIGMTSQNQRIIEEEMIKNVLKEYERQAGILGKSLMYNEKKAKVIVNESFLSSTWSERLWGDQEALREELDILLNKGVRQGKHPTVLAKDLRKRFDVSQFNTERLLVTELARVDTSVQKDSFKQGGYDQYEYVAKIDDRTTKECRGLDGHIFSVEDMQPGENAPPMHPFCRSSIAAYVSREEFEADLARRGL